jgi:hypothetical protein
LNSVAQKEDKEAAHRHINFKAGYLTAMDCHHPPSQSLAVFEALVSDVTWCEVLGMLEALLPNVIDECEDLVFHYLCRYLAVCFRAFRTNLGNSNAHRTIPFRSLPCSSASQRIQT